MRIDVRKSLCGLALCLLATAAAVNPVAAQKDRPAGTLQPIWLPDHRGQTAQAAQVIRNQQYFSIRLVSAYIPHQAGWWNNIRWVAVTSAVTLKGANTMTGTTVQATAPAPPRNRGLFITDSNSNALVTVVPATYTEVDLQINFRGYGEDRLQPVFALLANPELSTAISLSPQAKGSITAISAIVQSLTASPYAKSPKPILDLHTGLTVYAFANASQPDALRAGQMLIIGSPADSGADLGAIAALSPDDFRVLSSGAVQVQSNGRWQLLTDYPYAVFDVIASSTRGLDEDTAWYKTFNAIGGIDPGATDAAKTAAGDLSSGITLLENDPDYLPTERACIEAMFRAEETILLNGEEEPSRRKLFGQACPDYLKALDQDAGRIRLQVLSAAGTPVPNVRISVHSPALGLTYTAVTNALGIASIPTAAPDRYIVKASLSGFSQMVADVKVDPKTTKLIQLNLKQPH